MQRKSRLTLVMMAILLMVGMVGIQPAKPVQAAATDLFFSEYIEGSSNNKAVEIFNGTGSPVSLSNYQILVFANGSGTGTAINLSGTLQNNDVYVVAHNLSNASILALADQTSGSLSHNGDDAVALRNTLAGRYADVIGQVGFDPGNFWGTEPVTTINHTLVRKCAIAAGDPAGLDQFDPAAEWDSYATDTITNLGSHTTCWAPEPPVINEFSANTIGTDVEFVEFFGSPNTDYSAYTLLGIEGDFNATNSSEGFVDNIIPLGTTDANGFLLVSLAANAFENGTLSLLLVKDNTATLGVDIDADDNGVIDVTYWSEIRDGVAVNDGGTGDLTYATPVLTNSYDGIPFVPGGASRIPDGTDTDTTADWVRNDFDLAGIPGFAGSIASGEAYNTPGAANQVYVETAPTVVSTIPSNGGNHPNDESITITFSERVTVTDPWFSISCGTSGAHNAVVTDADPVYTLNPDVNFTIGESCTVTITAANVVDDDEDDTTYNAMLADYAFTFTAVTPPERCGDAFTPTYQIQGTGETSPLAGTTLATEGVVVGDFQVGGKAGYYIQDPTGDGNPATSDGIFVYNTSTAVNVGDKVRVRGTAVEYFGITEISPVTQVWVCSTGNTVAPTPVTLPVAAVSDFEKYESMLVTFPQSLIISEYFNFDRYGEIVLTSTRHMTPTALVEPGAPAQAEAAAYLLDRITLDDGRTAQNPDPAIHPNGSTFNMTNLFRGGATVTNVTGILDFYQSLYRVQPTTGAVYQDTNPRTAAPDITEADLKVASFNVLNYFVTLDDGVNDICGPDGIQECRGADDAEEFGRQKAKILSALDAIDADVFGLMEIENDSPVSGNDAVADLVAGLNAINGAGTYAYIDTGSIGGDAIKQAILYKPSAVTPVGEYQILDSSIDSRFIDTANRPVLAQVFMDNETGVEFVVAVNHLKSKGSACAGDPDLGDGAGNCNLTRKAAAEALVDWLANPTYFPDVEKALVIGDLNSYDKEDPIDMIKLGADDIAGTDDDFKDMIFEKRGELAYGYVFDGQTGYLDHALASQSLAENIVDVNFWHINADEPDLIDYDTSFKAPAQDALYAPDAYRSSDHDPVIVTLSFVIPDTIAPVMEAVTPAEGLVTLGLDDTFVLTVDAFDLNLYSLEVDHSFEGTLPEFTVYASATNPWGSQEAKAGFDAYGMTISYDETAQKWTIDFGETITDTHFIPNGVTFYVVLHDEANNKWGSMSPTTPDNTFVYTFDVSNTLEPEITSAVTYVYSPVYDYVGDIVFDDPNNIFTATFSPAEFLAGGAMNDLARYLGALYRQDTSTVITIVYDGVTYTWDETGTLKGSNWEDASGNTLVSAMVADWLAAPGDLVITVGDGWHTANVTFKLLITNTLDDEIESAPSYVYDPIYTYIGTRVFDDATNLYTVTYDDVDFNPNAMYDLARYLGALHRQDAATVTSIVFGGVTYTWSPTGTLHGSNWVDGSGKTLVSAVVAGIGSYNPAVGLVFTVADGVHTENVTFKFVILDTIAPEIETITAIGADGFTDVAAVGTTITVDRGYKVDHTEIVVNEPVAVAAGTVVTLAGQPYGTITVDATGLILTITPYPGNEIANLAGSFVFSVPAGSITDLAGNALETLSLTLVVNNVAPVAVADAYTVLEDAVLTVAAPGVLGNDVDYDVLSATLVDDVTNGTLTFKPDGGFEYTPDLNWFGTDTFTYKANDGLADSNVAAVTITVTAVNDIPVAEDQAVTTPEDTAIDITLVATDIEGDPLEYMIVDLPTNGTVTLVGNVATYTPDPDFVGEDSFTFTANDGMVDSNIATVTITVTEVKDQVQAVDDFYTMDEDTTLTIAAPGVLANDIDVDNNEQAASLVSGVQHGSLSLLGDGSFTYTPDPDFFGTDTFVYKLITYPAPQSLWTDEATVTITVNPIADAPVLGLIQNATIPELVAFSFTATATDVDLPPQTLTFSLVGAPEGAVITAGGVFTWTPTEVQGPGVYTFTVKVCDDTTPSPLCDEQAVTLTVTEVNSAPVALDLTETTEEDTPMDITLVATDAENNMLTYAIVDQPVHGSVTLVDDVATYTPELNFNGEDSFTYKANDGMDDSDMAVVTITVTPVNDAPVAVGESYSTNEDTALFIAAPGLLANDTDVDSSNLQIVFGSDPAHGVMDLYLDGSFRYTPVLNYFGSDSFTYKVTDGTAESNTVTVNLTVNPINDAPIAFDDNYNTMEDTTLEVPAPGVLANDLELDGDTLAVDSVVTQPLHGTLTLNPNGSFTYVPETNYAGMDSFTYKVTDGTGLFDEALVTIDVVSVNDWVVANDDEYETMAGVTLEVAAPGVLINDVLLDPNETVSLVVLVQPAGGTLTLNNDGSFTYVPNAGFFGVDTFEYQLNSTSLLQGEFSDTAIVTIKVIAKQIFLPLILR